MAEMAAQMSTEKQAAEAKMTEMAAQISGEVQQAAHLPRSVTHTLYCSEALAPWARRACLSSCL